MAGLHRAVYQSWRSRTGERWPGIVEDNGGGINKDALVNQGNTRKRDIIKQW